MVRQMAVVAVVAAVVGVVLALSLGVRLEPLEVSSCTSLESKSNFLWSIVAGGLMIVAVIVIGLSAFVLAVIGLWSDRAWSAAALLASFDTGLALGFFTPLILFGTESC